jgi:hypothetical protein
MVASLGAISARAAEVSCNELPNVGDAAYVTADIAEAGRLLRTAYQEDQCTRKELDKACAPAKEVTPACRAARHRLSLTDISNLLRLSLILERHDPAAILKHDPAAFRAVVLIVHHRIGGLSTAFDKGSLYRDRRPELLPLVEEAKRTGAIDNLLYTRFVTRLREDQEPSSAAADCSLTAADLAANAKLSFNDFDQRGVTPSTARKLGERGCYRAAAHATEHYLLFGPKLPAEDRDIVSWHLGQFLAYSGEEAAAAKVMATTRKPANPQSSALDWDSYVVGTWAFLTKDRALLEASLAKLSAAPGEGNANNASILRRLNDCFDKTYLEAFKICAK